MDWLKSARNQRFFISAIILFNLLDIIFTLTMVDLGFATEANPFMLQVMEKSYLAFSFIKLSLVSLCCFLLWRLRDYELANLATFFCFLTYSFLILYHIFGILISLHL